MKIFGIPVTPPLYYLWSMSLSQVDLMCADVSVTVYPKTDRCKGGRGGKRQIEFPRMSRASMQTARERWEKMKHDKANGIDRGFKKGGLKPL